jgi:predicted nucleic acid-binding protein
MSTYVVDASVAVKWFLPELDSEAACRLRDPSHKLLAPDYLWLEVNSVVCQRIQKKQILPEEGLQILPELKRFAIQLFPSADLLHSATHMAIETSTSFYDCLYLSLAVSQNAQMVTADRRFCRALDPNQFANRVMWIGNIR